MSSVLKRERLYVFILAALQFCHVLDFVIMMPLGPMFMREFSISPAQFGLLVSSYNLSAAPFTLLVGFVADRFDRRSFILANLLGFIGSTIYCGLSTSFEELVIARILAGAFGGALNAATFAVLADLIPEVRRGAATGAVMSSFSIASVLGVPLGLTIATTYNWHSSFLFIGAVSIFVWLGFFFHIPKLRDHLGGDFNMRQLVSAYKSVLFNRNYRMSFLFIAFIGFASFLLIPFISPFAVKNIGIAEEDLRLIYLTGGAFTFFSARYIGKICDSWGSLKTFYLVGCISIIPIFIYTHLGTTPLVGALVVTTLFMMTVSGRFVPCVTMGTQTPEPKDRGVFMSFFNAFRSLSTALAAYVGGLIVAESSTGELLHYERVGYLSIAMTLLCFYPATKLYQTNFAEACQKQLGNSFCIPERKTLHLFYIEMIKENHMKSSLMMAIFLFSQFSFSAEVIEGKRIKRFLAKDYAQISVRYGGGCAKHRFSLKIMNCDNKNKLCQLKLMHNRNGDKCEALIERTLKLKVPRARKICKYDWEILGDNGSSVKIEN